MDGLHFVSPFIWGWGYLPPFGYCKLYCQEQENSLEIPIVIVTPPLLPNEGFAATSPWCSANTQSSSPGPHRVRQTLPCPRGARSPAGNKPMNTQPGRDIVMNYGKCLKGKRGGCERKGEYPASSEPEGRS